MGPENNVQKNNVQKTEQLPFENLGIQQFIKRRGIESEDFVIIQELIDLAHENKNDLIKYFHNYFNPSYSKKKTIDRLRHDIELLKTQKDDDKKHILKLHELFLTLTDTYDHFTAYHLEGALEKL